MNDETMRKVENLLSKIPITDENIDKVDEIKKNMEKTHMQEKIELYQADFRELLENKIKEKMDIIFIDPPYQTDYAYESTKIILENKLMNENSILIIETDQNEKVKEQLKTLEIEIMDERKYGRVHLIFISQKRKG